MKTAVLYSGHMRSFRHCLENHCHQVFRHFPEADYFLSTVEDEDSSSVDLLKECFSGQVREISVHPLQPPFPLPPSVPADLARGDRKQGSPFEIVATPQGVIGQYWQLQNVWNLVPQDHDYECFIRIRPDIYFHEFTRTAPSFELDAHLPWWGRWGGCNDRFGLMGALAAEQYFTTFSRLTELTEMGCPLHPESLLKFSLERRGCVLHEKLKTSFSKMGRDGKILRGPEVDAIDIVHALMSSPWA